MQNVLNFIETYWRVILPILTIVFAITSYLIDHIKTKLKLKNGESNLKTFTNTMVDLISEAEKFVHYSGEEKQKYVLTRLREKYGDLFDEEKYKQYIDYFVAFTKTVNFNKGGR